MLLPVALLLLLGIFFEVSADYGLLGVYIGGVGFFGGVVFVALSLLLRVVLCSILPRRLAHDRRPLIVPDFWLCLRMSCMNDYRRSGGCNECGEVYLVYEDGGAWRVLGTDGSCRCGDETFTPLSAEEQPEPPLLAGCE